MTDSDKKPKWLKFGILLLVSCWVFWIGGNWEDEFSPEYVPPKFEQLQKSQGVISFTRRSKSSGGEIELRLDNGNTLHLTCSQPYSLPAACYYKREHGRWVNESYRDQLAGKVVTAWWMPEKKNSKGEGIGRVYQLQVDNQYFFEYYDLLSYYISYNKETAGHNWNFGLLLIFLTALVIWASFRKA
jgi:hypothetical protein